MTIPPPKVALVFVAFHSEPFLENFVAALKKSTYPKDSMTVVVVDNPHPSHGPSMQTLQEQLLPLSGVELPEIILLPQKENLGFAGGVNAGMRWAVANGYQYIFLHSHDGFLAPDAVQKLVEVMDADKSIGAAQCLLLMHPETELVNSAGNVFHYLGLGYCDQFRARKSDLNMPAVADVGYASGAALMLRADLVKQFGGFDDVFFLYHEDLAYALRLRLIGFRTVCVRDALFYHTYLQSHTKIKYYYIERNRYGALLMFYRWRTLLLLLPMALLLEAGMLFFYAKQRMLWTRLRILGYWLWPLHWATWLRLRRIVQRQRTKSDRTILADAATQVVFDDPAVNHPLLTRVGNPLMARYGAWLKRRVNW